MRPIQIPVDALTPSTSDPLSVNRTHQNTIKLEPKEANNSDPIFDISSHEFESGDLAMADVSYLFRISCYFSPSIDVILL